MEHNRSIQKLIHRRINEKAPLIQVIIGPRQVGKTTALKGALAGKGIYESADGPTVLSATVIESWWDCAEKHPDRLLAIDEVQKIADWSEAVKKRWDTSTKQIRLILTGSSALLVEKGLKETLAGRFELIRAEHWNFQEAHDVFKLNLRKHVEFGCYPGSIRFLNEIERWGNYVRDSIIEPAIGRDLLQLRPVEQPALLRQIFGVAVSLPAQVISLQKLQGQLQGKGTLPTLQSYLELLRDAFLITGIGKFSHESFRTRKSSPKLIVHDNSLMRAFERPIDKLLEKERFGFYFENAIGARLIEAGWDTYYWKDRKHEVDFVALGPGGEKWAIEVKSSATTSRELVGLKVFCDRYPEFTPCLVSFVGQKLNGVRSIPSEEILSFHRKY